MSAHKTTVLSILVLILALSAALGKSAFTSSYLQGESDRKESCEVRPIGGLASSPYHHAVAVSDVLGREVKLIVSGGIDSSGKFEDKSWLVDTTAWASATPPVTRMELDIPQSYASRIGATLQYYFSDDLHHLVLIGGAKLKQDKSYFGSDDVSVIQFRDWTSPPVIISDVSKLPLPRMFAASVQLVESSRIALLITGGTRECGSEDEVDLPFELTCKHTDGLGADYLDVVDGEIIQSDGPPGFEGGLYGHAMALDGRGNVVLTGGVLRGKLQDSIYQLKLVDDSGNRLNRMAQRWEKIGKLPHGVAFHSMAWSSNLGKLLIVGGIDKLSSSPNSLNQYVYTIDERASSQRFENLEGTSLLRGFGAALVRDNSDTLYYVGGLEQLQPRKSRFGGSQELLSISCRAVDGNTEPPPSPTPESLTPEPTPSCPSDGRDGVYLHSDIYFGGACLFVDQELEIRKFDIASTRMGDNDLSSFRVRDKFSSWEIQLYRDEDLRHYIDTFYEEEPDLDSVIGNGQINSADISSIRVIRLPSDALPTPTDVVIPTMTDTTTPSPTPTSTDTPSATYTVTSEPSMTAPPLVSPTSMEEPTATATATATAIDCPELRVHRLSGVYLFREPYFQGPCIRIVNSLSELLLPVPAGSLASVVVRPESLWTVRLFDGVRLTGTMLTEFEVSQPDLEETGDRTRSISLESDLSPTLTPVDIPSPTSISTLSSTATVSSESTPTVTMETPEVSATVPAPTPTIVTTTMPTATSTLTTTPLPSATIPATPTPLHACPEWRLPVKPNGVYVFSRLNFEDTPPCLFTNSSEPDLWLYFSEPRGIRSLCMKPVGLLGVELFSERYFVPFGGTSVLKCEDDLNDKTGSTRFGSMRLSWVTATPRSARHKIVLPWLYGSRNEATATTTPSVKPPPGCVDAEQEPNHPLTYRAATPSWVDYEGNLCEGIEARGRLWDIDVVDALRTRGETRCRNESSQPYCSADTSDSFEIVLSRPGSIHVQLLDIPTISNWTSEGVNDYRVEVIEVTDHEVRHKPVRGSERRSESTYEMFSQGLHAGRYFLKVSPYGRRKYPLMPEPNRMSAEYYRLMWQYIR